MCDSLLVMDSSEETQTKQSLSIDQLRQSVAQFSADVDFALVEHAYVFAMQAHHGALRKSGEPFIEHPLSVALTLADLGFVDPTLLASALLHDVIEDTHATEQKLRQEFGEEITQIVLGLTKLSEQQTGYDNFKAENLRKILLSSAKDSRVMLIKLSDRLHNMKTLSHFRVDKQQRIAKETLNVYAPIAEKIGLYQIKAQLEDLAFKHLHPDMYAFIEEKINATDSQRQKNTDYIIQILKNALSVAGIKFDISGRPKHFYSIFKKIVQENKTIEQIYDLYGIRIIAKMKDDCYKIYHFLQKDFREMEVRFKDFIQTPKSNGYQSLHANFYVEDKLVEVQIRTVDMDFQAESGIATHWKYKGIERDKKIERKLSWLAQIIRWKQKNVAERSVPKDIKVDMFQNEIIVVTPKGDPIILEEGATALDFAFAVHSNVGLHAKAIKVNDRVVPFNEVLQSGDIVFVETSTTQTVSHSWIGYVNSSSSVQKIRRALGIEGENSSPNKLKKKEEKVADISNLYHSLRQFKELSKKSQIKISKCCSPGIDDPIVAFYTKTKKVITVHKIDCPHQYALDPSNKVVFSQRPEVLITTHVVDILVDETAGVLVHVLNTFLSQNISIREVTSRETRHNQLISVTFYKRDFADQENFISKLQKIPGVLAVKFSQ